MKTTLRTLSLLLLVLGLSACAGTAATPSVDSALPGIYTSVAMTVTAAQIYAAPTSTLIRAVAPARQDTDTPVPTSTATASYSYASTSPYVGCEAADYLKDVTIPDGTVLSPGETFEKTWKFQNTGTCRWSSDFSLVFVDGDQMDGSDVPLDEFVIPNKRVEVSVELTAPDEEDTYIGYWELADSYGTPFGDIVSVEIVVAEATATSTPTAKATSTPTSTVTNAVTPTTVPNTSTAMPISTPAAATCTPTNPPTSVPATATGTPTSIPTSTPDASPTE